MTNLSVNINKFATLRNSRGGNNPDVVKAAIDCERFGAQGITLHPRPDERHIRYSDVYKIKKIVKTELNIEGYPTDNFLKLVKEIVPVQVTLVPDPPNVLTSNSGWDTIKHEKFLNEVISQLKELGIRTSLFINPVPELIENAAKTGTDRIELYTEPYAAEYKENREKAIMPYISAAAIAQKCGLGVNAGHDLSLENLKFFKENIPFTLEVSIGHALVCDAIYLGLENVVQLYLKQLR